MFVTSVIPVNLPLFIEKTLQGGNIQDNEINCFVSIFILCIVLVLSCKKPFLSLSSSLLSLFLYLCLVSPTALLYALGAWR